MVADEGMQVVVKPGACLIEGATGYETESRTMVVQAAGSTDRIDSVVLRLNDNIDFRDIDLYVVKGNSSTEPPQLTRTGGIYEIGLANLYVSANSSTITTERITDTRLVTARCGYAMPVQEFDTTALFDQLQAQVNENIELIQRAINQTEAAHLQEQIDSISSDIGTASIASISDGTIKGAVAKHEQDVNSLNLKMDSANNNISKKQDASTAITTSNIGKQSVKYALSSNHAKSSDNAKNSETCNRAGFSMYGFNTAEPLYRIYGGSATTLLALISNTGTYTYNEQGLGVKSGDGNSWRPVYAQSFVQNSSRIYKENIKQLSDDEAKKILNLSPVTFDFKKNYGGQQNCFGLIAEDTAKVIPSVVYEMDDAYGINYVELIPFLIKMIQIQEQRINELEQNN